MEVTVEYLGEVQFEVKARNHTISCDQPEEAGGFNEGMTPPELLLASLGTCAGYYAAEYFKTQHLYAAGMRILVSAEKAKGPARLSSFRIELECPLELNERQRQAVLRAMRSCLIHNTLRNPPDIELDVIAPGRPEMAAA